MENEDRGTLQEGEFHPAAHSALIWIKQLIATRPDNWAMMKESLASTALSGNRLSEVCMSTIDRLESGAPVSDRYLLGLVWVLRGIIDSEIRDENTQEELLNEEDAEE